ncbi:ABC transporter permease [Streptomyces sp. NPDC095613]|uniref:ABC transporter permease n=1 Tax=Streptomyces sp. NPDC095613 TaxID=3155540 RepID=UPI003332D484
MRTLRRTWRLPSARIALTVLALVAVVAVSGGALAPHDPLAQSPVDMLRGPSAAHPLGTDYLGRDVLSRLLAGTGRSVVGALEAVGAAMLLGIVPGIASVWLGRSVEWTVQRVADTLMIMPFTVFAIAVVGALGNGMHQAMLALGVLFAPLYFRVTRAAALGLRKAQYVEAAELMGASPWWILRTHVWGKILPTVAVTTAQAVGQALLVVASLTFLGLGVQPPAPTWGGMLASDLGYLAQQPWAPLIPGAAIMLTVGALNILADAVRDAGAPDGAAARGPAKGGGKTWRTVLRWTSRTAPPGTPGPEPRPNPRARVVTEAEDVPAVGPGASAAGGGAAAVGRHAPTVGSDTPAVVADVGANGPAATAAPDGPAGRTNEAVPGHRTTDTAFGTRTTDTASGAHPDHTHGPDAPSAHRPSTTDLEEAEHRVTTG